MCDLYPLNFLAMHPELPPQEDMESPTPKGDSLLDTAQREHFLKVCLTSVLLDSHYSPRYVLKIRSIYATCKAK